MKTLLSITISLLIGNGLIAQVGIGTITPHTSSVLEIKSNNKGFLPPRHTLTTRNNISNPSAGLIIYCTDCCETGMLSIYNGSKWGYPIDCSLIDLDDDGIPNNTDIDDDNDGIPDLNESTELVLNNYSSLPSGLPYSSNAGMRITDASGNYAIDIYDSYTEFSPNTSHTVQFNTTNGEVTRNTHDNSKRAYAVITWTTENSPVAWEFETLTLDNIQSLSNNTSSSCDAYSFDNQATWDYLPSTTSTGVIVDVDPNTISKIGDFLTTDPDATAGQLPHQVSDIGVSPSFELPYTNSNNSINQVLLNLYGNPNNHSVQANFSDKHTSVKLHIWDAAEDNSMGWTFIASTISFIDEDTDSDGIPNHLDLDSDNDGCPDALESEAVTLANQSEYNATEQAFNANVGANGLHQTIEVSDNLTTSLNYSINTDYLNNSVSTACP